ncbi:MAG: pyrroline-5-carboxylate reductase [Candidatus Zeuxoniibacter abyssi]|nr:MAG: pyrroline-5-carboxylate reductase [Candidatus Persebacteraceae bacterium AB1(2)]
MEKIKIGFIGGGHMAGALIGGLLKVGEWPPENIFVAERNENIRLRLSQDRGVCVLETPSALPKDLAAVIVAVRPADVRAACADIGPGVVVISIAAGVPIAVLKKWLGRKNNDGVARVMPNTPASLGYGMSVGCGDKNAQAVAVAIFSAVGEVLWTDDESMLAAVTAVSGGGPGYVYYFMEALEEAAVNLGLSGDWARRLVIQTVVGGAVMASQSGEPPAALRRAVAVSGGTTEQALSVLEARDFRKIVQAALKAANDRAKRIGAQYENDD